MLYIRRLLAATLVVLVCCPIGSVGAEDVAGEYVQVRPIVGKAPAPIRKFLTDVERRVLNRLEDNIRNLPDADPTGDAKVVWHVEPSAQSSPAFRLQNKVLRSLREMLAGTGGFSVDSRVDIIVARSQAYIQRILAELNCRPDLSAFDGQLLMGAALCNRHVIVSNLTGYLWLMRPSQRLTPRMERRVEPPLAQLNYRIAARSSSGLAHEWVHFFRMAGFSGRVAADEPLWFAEGFAEFWSNVAKARAFKAADAMLRTHVVRLRDFYDWERMCPGPLSRYRTDQGNSCHYHLGMLAVEYLVANYGGLEASNRLFVLDGFVESFREGFVRVFGLTIEEFEVLADKYIETIRRAELTK